MALTLLAANNAQTVLAAGISSSATSMTVNTGTGSLFPSPSAGTSFFKLTFVDAATGQLTEIVHVTARSGDTMTIERGQEGTVARAWSANDIVANMMTAGTLSYVLTNFQPLDATLTAIAALTGAANKLAYFNGADTAALTDLTSVGRDVIGQSSVANLLTYLGLGDGHGRLINIQVFSSSGTYTKTAGAVKGRALVQGAGGAGGGSAANSGSNISAGGGGDAGSYGETGLIDLTGVTTVPVTVGAGGTGSSAAAGTNGGSSSFGSYIVAPGGLGASAGSTVAGTAFFGNGHAATSPCTGTNVIVNIPGGGGYEGEVVSSNRSGVRAGSGGDSVLGKGGSAQVAGYTPFSGSGYGSGGAGSAGAATFSTAAGAGANGANGIVIFLEYA